jgi:hypothetical protein
LTTRTCLRLALLAATLLAPAAGRAAAQAAVVGTYTYSWTDTAGAPITAVSVTLGQTVAVQIRLTEGGGGNLFSAGGVTSYDDRTTWTNSNVSIAKSGTGATANTFIRTNPYPSGTGFNGPGGTVTNTSTDGFNANHVMNLSRAVQSTLDPSTFVKSSTPPNTGNTILLTEFRIQGDAEGTTVMTVQQNPLTTNNAYYDASSGLFFNYDAAIGSAFADLTVTVTPVPEPATAFAVVALGLAGAAVGRRARDRATRSGSCRRGA